MKRRLPWVWLYASSALALAPLFLVATLVPEGAVRTLLEAVAALILIGALALWVRVTRIGLELQGRRPSGWRQATITVAASERPPDLLDQDREDPSRRPELTTTGRRRSLDRKDFHHEGFAFVPRG